jgi:mono/diheme cytochrome c family protein
MKNSLTWVGSAMLLIGLVCGCSDLGDQPPTSSGPDSTLVSYAGEIHLLLTDHCVSCHSSPANPAFGDLDLTTHASLMDSVGPHAPVVIPMNPDSSYLIQKIEGTAQPRMPQGGPFLTNQQISLVRLWIEQGALDN